MYYRLFLHFFGLLVFFAELISLIFAFLYQLLGATVDIKFLPGFVLLLEEANLTYNAGQKSFFRVLRFIQTFSVIFYHLDQRAACSQVSEFSGIAALFINRASMNFFTGSVFCVSLHFH